MKTAGQSFPIECCWISIVVNSVIQHGTVLFKMGVEEIKLEVGGVLVGVTPSFGGVLRGIWHHESLPSLILISINLVIISFVYYGRYMFQNWSPRWELEATQPLCACATQEVEGWFVYVLHIEFCMLGFALARITDPNLQFGYKYPNYPYLSLYTNCWWIACQDCWGPSSCSFGPTIWNYEFMVRCCMHMYISWCCKQSIGSPGFSLWRAQRSRITYACVSVCCMLEGGEQLVPNYSLEGITKKLCGKSGIGKDYVHPAIVSKTILWQPYSEIGNFS